MNHVSSDTVAWIILVALMIFTVWQNRSRIQAEREKNLRLSFQRMIWPKNFLAK